MTDPEQIERWRGVLARLRRGPAPRGEEFDLCREVLAVAPATTHRRTAARRLLEGAMADAGTSIADAQEVMALLKALDTGDLEIGRLLTER
ncbi:MAG TPA: hypothetical protein VMT19_11770 [Thermoanaerobaculaceae bacterium]|nr:hypothetical protein [Thermoanaerobaculaceae bacterium]